MSKDTLDLTGNLDFSDNGDVGSYAVDFDSLPDNQPLPRGVYNVDIVKAEPAISKSKKTMIKLQLKVTVGEHEGTYLFDTLSFASDASKRMVKQKLKGMGVTGGFKDLTDLSNLLNGVATGVKVGIRAESINQATNQPYPPSNNVLGYTPITADVGDLF